MSYKNTHNTHRNKHKETRSVRTQTITECLRKRRSKCVFQGREGGRAKNTTVAKCQLRSSGQMPRQCERSRHESETRIYSTKPPTHTRKSREKIEWYKMSGARFKKI